MGIVTDQRSEQRTPSPACTARLAGLGWHLLDDVAAGRVIDRYWTGLAARAEWRAGGGRRIARFRWTLSSTDPAGSVGAGAAGGARPQPRDEAMLVQSSSIDADGVHVTSAVVGRLLEDRHLVCPSWVRDELLVAQRTCLQLDTGVSSATIRRVFDDRIRRDGRRLETWASEFVDGLLVGAGQAGIPDPPIDLSELGDLGVAARGS